MFDFIRNLTKTESEKRQERLSAYLDDALTPRERAAFEEQLRSDFTLQTGLEQHRLLKENIGRLPLMRAPRNFTLDPAAYGRPAPQPAVSLYPIMRTATALAAVMLVFLFSLELFSPSVEQTANAPDGTIALSERELDEFSSGEGAAGSAEDAASEAAPAAELPAVEEEMAAEEVMEEEAVEGETAEEAAAEEPQAAPTADRDLLEVYGETEPYPVPVAGQDAAANAGPTVETATEQSAPIPAEAEDGAGTADIDGSLPSPTTPATTGLSDDSGFAFSVTTTVPENDIDPNTNGLTEPPPPPLRFLQIGLGVLFVVLLAATLLLRRQL